MDAADTPTLAGDEPTLAGESTGTGETAERSRGSAPRSAQPSFARGQSIGRYVVVDRLGAGGMGVVYACYDPELDRKVAVKVLRPRPGGSTRGNAGAAGLVREAQAMASLSHPNVVTVHDVGTVGQDVFIAMEHVDGGTLKQWLAREEGRPALEAIVEVFTAAGQGLAAAHAAGLVHRDFKPDNVMIGRDGRVRVMDFGLARRVIGRSTGDEEQPGAGSSDLGATEATLGTPAYMSPEQHFGRGVDARSDQFSFCVALYEAVYRERPFAADDMATLLYQLHHGEVRPEPEGARVPAWLRRVLLRGLHVEPEQRFDDMSALLAELHRDRDGARRWALRLGAVGLLGGAVAYATLQGHAEPEPCAGGRERIAAVWGDDQAAKVQAVFESTGRPYAADTFARVRAQLDGYVDAWAEEHREACEATQVRREQSEELLDLRMTCLREREQALRETVQGYLASDEGAEAELARAVELAHALPPVSDCADVVALGAPVRPPADPQQREAVAAVRESVARVRALTMRGRYGAAVELASTTVEQARAQQHAPTTALALFWLGRAQALAGDHRAAETTLLEAAEQAAAGHDDPTAAQSWIELVQVVGATQARAHEGELLARVAAAANERRDAGPQARADLAVALAAVFKVEARFDDARAQLERALALRQAASEPDEVAVARVLVALGDVALEQGRFDDATGHYEQARTRLEASLGAQHPEVARVYNSMGNVAIRAGRLDQALRHHRAALAIREASLGAQHPDVGASLNNLAAAHEHHGDLDEALALNLRALAVRRAALGESHPNVAMSLSNIGNVYKSQGRLPEALTAYEQSLAIRTEALGPSHPATAESLGNLATLHETLGHVDEAIEYQRRALGVFEQSLGPAHPNVAAARLNLATMYQARGDWEAATREAEAALDGFLAAHGPRHRYVALARYNVGRGWMKAGRREDGLAQIEQAGQIFVTEGTADDLMDARLVLANAAWEHGDRKQAEQRVRTAADDLGDRPGAQDARARGQQWLAEHGLPALADP